MGLRERKRQRTRETIAKVAYELFHEQGYDQTTVEQIAERADVSPRTFYRYFESKDGVLAEGGYAVVDRTLERTGEDRSVEALVGAMALVYEELVAQNHFRDYAKILRQNPSIADRAPLWRDRWSRYLAAQLAADDGGDLPTLDHRVRGGATIHIVATAVDEWLYRGRDADIPELAEETIAYLRASLSPAGRGDEQH